MTLELKKQIANKTINMRVTNVEGNHETGFITVYHKQKRRNNK